jgi:hypothetical protein
MEVKYADCTLGLIHVAAVYDWPEAIEMEMDDINLLGPSEAFPSGRTCLNVR